mgnify:CR=1 FL=1
MAFVIGRALEKIKFQWMGEAGAALLLGLFVGLILKAAGVGADLASTVAFKVSGRKVQGTEIRLAWVWRDCSAREAPGRTGCRGG